MAQDKLDEFLALPKEERGRLFEQLAPEKQQKLMGMIQQRKGGLTAGPDNKMGLYRMLPNSQQGYTDTSQQIEVPFDRVTAAMSKGYHLHSDEEPRYQHDSAHQKKSLGSTLSKLWDQTTQAVEQHLAPVPDQKPQPEPKPWPGPNQTPLPGPVTNVDRAAGRMLYGIPGYLRNLYAAVRDSRISGNATEVANMIDPGQMPKGLYDQFQSDWKQDHKLAIDNLYGSLVGMGAVAAVTHGAAKAWERAPSAGEVAGAGLEKTRQGIQGLVGASQREVNRRVSNEVKEAGTKQDAVRAANVAATEETLNKRGKVDEANVKQLKQEAAERLGTRRGNKEARAKRNQEREEIAQESRKASEDIEKRRAAEEKYNASAQELSDEIAKTEPRLDDEDRNNFDAIRSATAGIEEDIGPLQQVVEMAKTQADPTTSPLFRSILNEGGTGLDEEGRPLVGGKAQKIIVDGKEVPVNDRNYAFYYEAQFGVPPPLEGLGGKTNFSRLQRWYTYINDRMYSGAKPEPGTLQALRMTRNAINKAMQSLAEKAGEVDDPRNPGQKITVAKLLQDARKFHEEKMEAFSDSPNEKSTVATTVQQKVAPEFAKESKLTKQIAMLAKYSPTIAQLAEHIGNLRKGLEALPDIATLEGIRDRVPPPAIELTEDLAPLDARAEGTKPIPKPEPPHEYGEPEGQRPIVKPELDTGQIRRELIDEKARKWGLTGYDVAIMGSGFVADMMAALFQLDTHGGFRGAAFTYVGTKVAVQWALHNEAVLGWLARAPAEEVNVLNKIPGIDKVRIKETLRGVVEAREREGRPTPVNAAVKAFLAGSAVGSHAQKSLKDIRSEGENRKNKQQASPAPGPQSTNRNYTHIFDEASGRIIPV